MKRSDVTVSKTSYEHRVVFIKKTGKVIGHLWKTWGDYPSHTGWDAGSISSYQNTKFFAYQKDAVRWVIDQYQSRQEIDNDA